MKKQFIVIFFLLLIIGSSYSYFSCGQGWLTFRKNNDTPKNYLSNVKIKKDDYSKDSLEILKHLSNYLKRHDDFFFSKAYFDSTDLIIDSILYSPSYNRLAVFVITKNPTLRQLVPSKKHKYYYDATCYLGIREKDTISLSWIGPVFTNSYDLHDISNDIREACLRNFITKDTSSIYANIYKYNMNDTRFWDCDIWKKIKEDKIKKQEF